VGERRCCREKYSDPLLTASINPFLPVSIFGEWECSVNEHHIDESATLLGSKGISELLLLTA
jgi:hypothetical protein